jgi:hypothetical protein
MIVLLGMLASPAGSGEALPYAVTPPDDFSAGTVDARTVYDNKAWGSLDSEAMPQVRSQDSGPGLPPPQIVPYTKVPEAQEVLIGPVAKPAPPAGEDRVFEQIRAAPPPAGIELMPGAD